MNRVWQKKNEKKLDIDDIMELSTQFNSNPFECPIPENSSGHANIRLNVAQVGLYSSWDKKKPNLGLLALQAPLAEEEGPADALRVLLDGDAHDVAEGHVLLRPL